MVEILRSGSDDEFRRTFRMTRPAFKALAGRLRREGVFEATGNRSQVNPRHQIAIALYRFGSSGNRGGLMALRRFIVNTPDLRIIDYATGFAGARHDASCWPSTRIFRHHERLLEVGDFVIGDSAYPLEKWLLAPYRAPEKSKARNGHYNNTLSRIRVCSEHAIGYLKQRFPSLTLLPLRINSKNSFAIANRYVEACIIAHRWAQENEHFGEEDDPWAPPLPEDNDPRRASDSEYSDDAEEEVTGFVPPRSTQHIKAAKGWRVMMRDTLFAEEKEKTDQAKRRAVKKRRRER
ncbi:hypothetical protein JCM11641_005308 [Rhodosporidiobolus odoratus]